MLEKNHFSGASAAPETLRQGKSSPAPHPGEEQTQKTNNVRLFGLRDFASSWAGGFAARPGATVDSLYVGPGRSPPWFRGLGAEEAPKNFFIL